MDYEKKYKEALEKAKEYYKDCKQRGNLWFVEDMEDMFPELKESEDERIRKWIIGILSTYEHDRDLRNAAIAYLEKQGEQKPANKVEPKFKVGDWISGYYTNYKVLSVNNDGYLVEDVDGSKINILFENEKFHHLWTIQDAKDGDVLEYQGEIFIIRELKKKVIASRTIEYYCCYDGEHFINNSIYSLMDDDLVNIHPSTHKQHNLLLQKMHEAGYEWDAEKKELKKIEQNSAWSEEDKSMFDFAIRAIALCRQYAINNQIKGYSKLSDTPKRYEELQDWLKSLRPGRRYHS